MSSKYPAALSWVVTHWGYPSLNALSFASLAYVASRKGQHTMAALLAAGAWLFFGVTGVLVWAWR